MATWQIGRRAKGCQGCDEAFEPGCEHFTLLDIQSEDWARVDLCPSCFEKREELGNTPFWRTRRPLSHQRAQQVDLDALKALLPQLVEMELDLRQRQLTYLIALILLRKKRFKLAGSERDADGTDRLVLAEPGGDMVVKPIAEPPTRAEMPSLRKALQNLLSDPSEDEESLLPERLFGSLCATEDEEALGEGESSTTVERLDSSAPEVGAG